MKVMIIEACRLLLVIQNIILMSTFRNIPNSKCLILLKDLESMHQTATVSKLVQMAQRTILHRNPYHRRNLSNPTLIKVRRAAKTKKIILSRKQKPIYRVFNQIKGHIRHSHLEREVSQLHR